jgi:predicted nucleotidyltransferase
LLADEGKSVKGMNVEIPKEKIADFCRKWKIVELSLFGSVLRDDFRPASDVDVLVTFARDAEWSLLDHTAMEEELSALFGRKVDLVSRKAIERSENYIRRDAILGTAQPYYVAR